MKLVYQLTAVLLLAACVCLANESRRGQGEAITTAETRACSTGAAAGRETTRGGRERAGVASGDAPHARPERPSPAGRSGGGSARTADGVSREPTPPRTTWRPCEPPPRSPQGRGRGTRWLSPRRRKGTSSCRGGASRHAGREGQGPSRGENQHSQEVINMEWMRANLSSLWVVVRELSRQHARFVGHRGHVGRGRGHGSVGPVVGEGHPSCPVGDDDCRMEGSEVCGGHGECSCGHCICHPGFYGTYCQCSDHTCPLYDGMKCGGPTRGQCRCGGCVCRPGYTGEACDCPTDTLGCVGSANGTICSAQGTCECGRCRCDDGYKGMYCEDTVYAAGVCEKLKPCVLCKAWNRDLLLCADCQITITMVDKLEPAKNTCVMVNSGCILKYSYIPQGPDAYTVLVPRDMQCPPKSEDE
ncbi:integrin beta 6 [Penaeus vannamei]|uniref:Integrin beta 6 n=1 Tax=Penaeus vannamei TaxID=6689 RepID=A0A423TGV2_PENVA|nr:integrin beta 6 [Penaeus vannamei]